MPAERLQKLLARAGRGSRRAAERLIVEGRVTVDGRVATLGERVDPSASRIEVDGAPLAAAASPLTIMLNKPPGYLVTASDPRGRPTVYDLLPRAPPGLRYAGRLDRDTGGLLVLTTDGGLVQRLTHPRHGVEKVYEAEVRGVPSQGALRRLRRGVALDDGVTAPAEVALLDASHGRARVRIALHEGRKRQVRRMLKAVGHPVLRLTRTAVGGLELGDLAPGAWRALTAAEERRLRRAAGAVDAPAEAPI